MTQGYPLMHSKRRLGITVAALHGGARARRLELEIKHMSIGGQGRGPVDSLPMNAKLILVTN